VDRLEIEDRRGCKGPRVRLVWVSTVLVDPVDFPATKGRRATRDHVG
jgi:hypothetical protein